jgi:dethiobiotin synthetase
MVAGTHAGAGKTVVAAAIVQSLRHRGVEAVAMKTVAMKSRASRVPDRDEMRRLASASAFDLPPHVLCGYWLDADNLPCDRQPSRSNINLDDVVETFGALSTWADTVIVEEAHVADSFNHAHFMGDELARELNLPVVLVVGIRDGCVPLALARARSLSRRGLALAGWIANQAQPVIPHQGSVLALRELLPAPCLGSLPWLPDSDAVAASEGIEMDRILSIFSQGISAHERVVRLY